MQGAIRTALTAAIGNYPLTFVVIGLIAAGIAIGRARDPTSRELIVDKLLGWHIFFVIGAMYLVNFIMHAFFGRMSAAVIGWADSPFQFEVATASLGFAAVGFYAAFRSFSARVAAILGPAIFMLGAAYGHVQQMMKAHDFAPGNAGVIFWMDILIPLLGFALLAAQSRLGRPMVEATHGH